MNTIRIGLLTALLVNAVVLLESPTSAAEDERRTYALVGGTLINGTGSDPVRNAAVVIRGDRILYAGTRNAINIPPGVEVIDTSGLTILPGFVNAHVHFAGDALPDEGPLRTWASEGVTTVLELSSVRLDVLRRIDAERQSFRDPSLARALYTGPLIQWVDDARETTETILDGGADMIKVYMEDGALRGTVFDVLPLDDLRMIVRVAHGHGVDVVAHIQQVYLLEQGLDGGLDTIVHSQLDEEIPETLISRMAAKDVYVVPTLEIYSMVPAYQMTALVNLELLMQGGVKIALGSDYDIGFSMELGMPLREMQLMQQAGMTPMEIIIAGTRNGAHVLGLEHEIGTVQRGKLADIIVVAGDPLQDLTVLKRMMVMVIHYGVIIRNEL